VTFFCSPAGGWGGDIDGARTAVATGRAGLKIWWLRRSIRMRSRPNVSTREPRRSRQSAADDHDCLRPARTHPLSAGVRGARAIASRATSVVRGRTCKVSLIVLTFSGRVSYLLVPRESDVTGATSRRRLGRGDVDAPIPLDEDHGGCRRSLGCGMRVISPAK